MPINKELIEKRQEVKENKPDFVDQKVGVMLDFKLIGENQKE